MVCPENLGVCLQLLPLMWLGLLALTLLLLAVLKWLLVNRVKPASYQKYSWAFQTKAVNAAIQVRICCLANTSLRTRRSPPIHQYGNACVSARLSGVQSGAGPCCEGVIRLKTFEG